MVADHIHPFLKGNFAPVTDEFDGDGMLHGVYFAKAGPLYTNRHLATPLLSMTLLLLRSPLPSIALLISPLSSLHRIVTAIIQAFLIAVRARMGVLSVANTSVVWWGRGLGEKDEEEEVEDILKSPDQRLLATCESGPPLEVRLPELQTVGWDRLDEHGETLSNRRGRWEWWKRFGLSRVQEMFDAPHVRYSVINSSGEHIVWKQGVDVGRAKMMHDFAATRTHTILLNLPLTLAPHNLFSTHPVPLIHFDRTLPSEFVIFPRLLDPSHQPIRFRDLEPSLIFHTANAWDSYNDEGNLVAINMLGCRFRSAKLVYAAGAIDVPIVEKAFGENDIVRLQYYRFDMQDKTSITHNFPLTAIPFEFPTLPPHLGMTASKYVYGCTMQSGSFDERLGGAAKVDCIAKINVEELIRRGLARGEGKNDTPVDDRTSAQIVRESKQGLTGPIELFEMPSGWYAQEPRFVPRHEATTQDDGYLITYADGIPSSEPGSGSELWIIDAKHLSRGMSAVTARIKLPQRVPYGLHGTFVPASLIKNQRSLASPLPHQDLLQDKVARSRLQHFVSILFDRPMYREKSRTERAILAIMLPCGVAMLALAIREIIHVI
ncbi:uncharacterized protein I303_103697 [Kwoniella dejecticola CBS 10117]|uniref:Carotenoid oxygenase n=1 Tax=Kwoniella dejecticola CBS 10117 TaxID=1296121 RepID=A0AAJ8KMC2_9TREE